MDGFLIDIVISTEKEIIKEENTCCMKPMLFQDVLGTKVSLIEGRRSWIPAAVKSHHQMLGIPANYFIFLSTLCCSTHCGANVSFWTNYPEAALH